MATKSIIDGITSDGLCIGCGLCESICGAGSVKMKLQQDGFFRPVVSRINLESERIVAKVCPGVNVVNDIKFNPEQRVWGKIEQLYTGYSTDNATRNRGSSGGIVSAIGIFMLEQGLVNAVLQVGGDSEDFERNSLKISRTKDDVLHCASSRYAPALVFDKILEILESGNEKYCFIGKPCDISALKNLFEIYPQYKERFALTVSIICAGMPSFDGTQAIINEFNARLPVKNLVYRGNGWPGYFSFTDKDQKNYQKSYNDSWGKTLNRYLNFRCKICPDGIGLQADIAVGDAWETKDGYPDFTEKEGLSLVLARTVEGVALLKLARQKDAMVFSEIDESVIALMQPYQYQRRKRVGIRVLGFAFGKQRLLNYRHIHLWRNLIGENPLILLKEFAGTLRRSIKYKIKPVR